MGRHPTATQAQSGGGRLSADLLPAALTQVLQALLEDHLELGARASLEQEGVERCQPFATADATVMEPGLLIVVGHRAPTVAP